MAGITPTNDAIPIANDISARPNTPNPIAATNKNGDANASGIAKAVNAYNDIIIAGINHIAPLNAAMPAPSAISARPNIPNPIAATNKNGDASASGIANAVNKYKDIIIAGINKIAPANVAIPAPNADSASPNIPNPIAATNKNGDASASGIAKAVNKYKEITIAGINQIAPTNA